MPETDHPWTLPRMTLWLVVSIVLYFAASWVAERNPGSILAVMLHKANLMSLGGWGGYWLDRGLYPYARPHAMGSFLQASDFQWSMMRRALIVVGCLICVGLGA